MAWFVLINDYMIEISAPLLGEIFPLYLFVILYVWLCCWWVYSSLAVEAWPKFWVWAPMCIHSFYHLSSTANLTFDFNSASVASHGKYKILTTHSDSESIWHSTNYYIESLSDYFLFKISGFLVQPKIDFSVMHDGLNAWMKKQDCSSILFSYLYDEVHLDCGFDSRCKCSTPWLSDTVVEIIWAWSVIVSPHDRRASTEPVATRDMTLAIWGAWLIWKQRNDYVFNNSSSAFVADCIRGGAPMVPGRN